MNYAENSVGPQGPIENAILTLHHFNERINLATNQVKDQADALYGTAPETPTNSSAPSTQILPLIEQLNEAFSAISISLDRLDFEISRGYLR